MDDERLNQIASEWIAYWDAYDQTGKFPEEDIDEVGVTETVDELIQNDPEIALDLVLRIMERVEPTPKDSHFGVLAAGPLEDLLSEHGATLIDQVETIARQNPTFNLLLGGVWQGGLSKEIWKRVRKCRLKSW